MTIDGMYFDTNGERVTFPHPPCADDHIIWNPKSIGGPAGAKTWIVECTGHIHAAQG